MLPPVPKAKAERVLERIEGLFEAREQLNDFTLASLKREARSSLGVDPVAANIALGGIAALEWRDNELDAYHLAAIRHEDSAVTRANYGTSLRHVERVFDSFDQYLHATEMEPADLELLDRAISTANCAGDFEKALELCEIFAKRCPGKEHESRSGISDALQVLRSRQYDRDRIGAHIRLAYDLLRERKIASSSTKFSTFTEPENEQVMYHIYLRRPIEEVEALEFELADRVFDQLDADLNAFWVGFSLEEDDAD